MFDWWEKLFPPDKYGVGDYVLVGFGIGFWLAMMFSALLGS